MLFKKNIINEDDNINVLSPTVLPLKSKYSDGRWEYLKRLDLAVNHDKCFNIAISGSYGTGKSSILETYITKYRLKPKALIVNIGSFLKTSNEDDEETSSENHEKTNIDSNTSGKENKKTDKGSDGFLSLDEKNLMETIEKTIVKQLIYKVKYSNSKLSKIPRIQNKWKIKYFIYSLIVTYIIAYLLFVYNKKMKSTLKSIIKNFGFIKGSQYACINNFSKIIFVLLFVLFVCKSLYYLFTVINKSKTKLKFDKYEMEIDNNTVAFSFVDNLYEILYSVINSKIEIVIFEDIDRYQKDVCLKVIEDLRDLNKIINECSSTMSSFFHKSKKITFIYSFKDSVFDDYTEKNKFYDYIISVMPISTRYNSPMHFVNELERVGIYSKVDVDLIRIAASYITDLRTIKNIANDCSLFIKVLNMNNVDYNQVLALCIYKNYDVNGYDKLVEFNNPIDVVLKKMKEIVLEECQKDFQSYSEKYSELELSLFNEKNTLLNSNLVDGHKATSIKINDNEYTIDEFMNTTCLLAKEDVLILKNEAMELNIDTSDNNIINKIVSTCTTLIKSKTKIDRLGKIIDNHDDNDLFDYSKEYLKDIRLGNKEKNIKLNDKNIHELDFVLVYSGYIRFDYIDYITSPMDNDFLTLRDSRFIFSYNHNIFNFDGRLDNPDNVLYYLGENSLNNPYMLNNDILKYIYELNNKKLKEKIMSQFFYPFDYYLDFLYQLKKKNSILYKRVILDLNLNFDIIWDSYFENINDFIKKDLKSFTCVVIDIFLANNFDISKIKNIVELSKIISKYADYTNIDFFNKKISLNNLINAKVYFEDISLLLNYSISDTLGIIVMNDLFELNKKNLFTILYFEKLISNPYELNYGVIKKSKYSMYLKESILKHLDLFASNVYLDQDDIFIIGDYDLIKQIITTTNNDNLIKEILVRESFVIKDYIIPYKYIDLAYKNNRIEINWNTLKMYNNIYPLDSGLLNIAIKNIKNYYNKNINDMKEIHPYIMRKILDKLFYKEDYVITNLILSNYTTSKLQKYNVHVNTKFEEIKQKVNYDLIIYTLSNFKKIAEYKDRVILYQYVGYFLKNDKISKIIEMIDYDMLINFRKLISDNDKMYILYNNCKNTTDSNINDIFIKVFSDNKTHTIIYKKEYEEYIFTKMMKYLEMYDIGRKIITFKVKSGKKQV